MRTITAMLAATALALTGAGPALAQCGSAQIIQVGTSSGDPEKNTFGFACSPADLERTSSVAVMRGQVLQVGTSTGQSEKDTLGYGPTISDR
jgi:hypothetical protein